MLFLRKSCIYDYTISCNPSTLSFFLSRRRFSRSKARVRNAPTSADRGAQFQVPDRVPVRKARRVVAP